MSVKLSVFSSTPDMLEENFLVKVLTGTLAEIAQKTVDWGYDGIEFMPNPRRIPDPGEMEMALKKAGAALTVVNSGRMMPAGMAILHPDPVIRRDSINAYKALVSFAGHFKSRVGLGVAQGEGLVDGSPEEKARMADEVIREIVEHAAEAGAVVMAEPIDPGCKGYVYSMDEARAWVERVNSPAFNLMMDTEELSHSEPTIEHGIRAGRGRPNHIHLYDPGRWPPGVRTESDRLDWAKLVGLLREYRFAGSGSVVLAPEGDPEPAARKSAAYLRRLFQA